MLSISITQLTSDNGTWVGLNGNSMLSKVESFQKKILFSLSLSYLLKEIGPKMALRREDLKKTKKW